MYSAEYAYPKGELCRVCQVTWGKLGDGEEIIMFSIKRKSGSIRNSERADDLPLTKTFLDVPLCTSVCLVDDIEQLIITCSTQTFYPFTYSVEQYPESHHS